MFKNYLKVALRNLWKNKTFSLINMVGLAIGLCCFLLIAVYVLDELSYDRFYKNADRIYRVNADIRFGGNELHIPETSDMMGAALKKDYPEVEEFTRIFNNNGNKLVKKGNEYIKEFNVAHADSTFFTVFQLSALEGNTHTALNEPNTVVVSESAAKKYFGTVRVLGKTIETNDDSSTLYKITAIIKDIPQNAHFNFDFLFSMKNVKYNWGQYLSHNFHTYLLLKKGTDYHAFEKKLPQYIDKYALPQARQFMHINSMDEFTKAGNLLVYSLEPLTEIHLYSNRMFEIKPGGNIQYVYIFSAIALFILFLACINFMNLTTARSANRAREVGIRKVLGTQRKNLVFQFLTESTLMVIFSLVIAVVIALLVLPLFNSISGKQMNLKTLFSPFIIPVWIVLPIVVGLVAGSYPAFYLSFFRPIEVLKGRVSTGANGRLRSALVIFQFATAIILIIGTIVVYSQLNYIQGRDIGFKKDQVLIVDDAYALNKNIDAFKDEMLQQPGVVSGTISSFLPVSKSSRSDNSYSKETAVDAKNGFNMQTWGVDYDYLKTMGMELVKGRNFSKDFGTDSSGVIINEATARFLGYEDPVGKKIYTLDTHPLAYTVIGVVRNFNYETLHKPVGPLGLFLFRATGLISFKVKAANVPSVLNAMETKWKTMAAGMPFSYRFLDESFTEMYSGEQRAGRIALIFSILAIFIACLGLFGLAAFVAEQRTKEIGIRKVLGANVNGIVRLLSKDFVVLVLIAFVIATPVAWWAMNKWLEDFAYRVNLSWWIFALAGCCALLIALLTVSFQAMKAALTNPVKNLRTE